MIAQKLQKFIKIAELNKIHKITTIEIFEVSNFYCAFIDAFIVFLYLSMQIITINLCFI